MTRRQRARHQRMLGRAYRRARAAGNGAALGLVSDLRKAAHTPHVRAFAEAWGHNGNWERARQRHIDAAARAHEAWLKSVYGDHVLSTGAFM